MSTTQPDEFGRYCVTVKLGGQLGKRFGKTYKIWLSKPAEALSFACSQLKGFEAYMRDPKRKTLYKVLVNDRQIDLDKEFHMQRDMRTVSIVPVIQGSKSGGLFQAVLGAALIGMAFTGLGEAAFLASQTATWGSAVFMPLGISLAMGGIAQMLSPQPNLDTSSSSTSSNTSLGTANPTVTNGTPVPLAFGRVCIAPIIVSSEIVAYDTTPAGGAA